MDDMQNIDKQIMQLKNEVSLLVKKITEKSISEPQIIIANNNEIIVKSEHFFFAFPATQLNHALSYLNPEFDLGMRHFIAHHTSPGTHYIDIGANAGVLSAIAAKNIGPSGLVVTIEPIESLAENISKNIAINAPLTPHTHHTCCAGDKNDTATFQIFERDNRVSTLFSYDESITADTTKKITVPVVPINTLIPEGTNDLFIKIDAEGAEFKILNILLAKNSPILNKNTIIAFEYAQEHAERAGFTPADLLALLDKHDLTAYYIHPLSGVMGAQFESHTVGVAGNLALEIKAGHLLKSEATSDGPTVEIQLKNHLQKILGRDPSRKNFICPCCEHNNDLNSCDVLVGTCMFSDLELKRFECENCDLIFGPIPLIECSPEELGLVYELIYKIYSEGDSRMAQEKTFYLLNPSLNKKYINYACGDWDKGVTHLNDLGWDVDGFEPFQKNTSIKIIKKIDTLTSEIYDGLFTHNYLEHVQNPKTFFVECARLLKPEGVMAHSTPCYSYCFEQSPGHLFFPRNEAIKHLARNTGFSISAHYQSDMEKQQLNIRYECYLFQKMHANSGFSNQTKL